MTSRLDEAGSLSIQSAGLACAQSTPAGEGRWVTPILAAAITAWVRLSTPSLSRMAETWAFTVASETPSS